MKKKNRKLLSLLIVAAMLLSLLPFGALPALAFNVENYRPNIREIHIGAPIPGLEGMRSVLPVEVHFTANEDLSDRNAVWFLEGILRGLVPEGLHFEGIGGLGMTLMGPVKPDVPLECNMFSWNWMGWEAGGEGIVKYNLPLLKDGETQTVEKSPATGQLEVNGLKPGDSVTFQIETVMNQSMFPEDVLPPGGSLFSNEVTVVIEELGNYPKTIKNCDHDWVWYNADDISHYQYCTKCNEMNPGTEGAHTWTVAVNTPATCTADAKITKTCAVCGRVNTSHKPDPATDAAELFAHHVWKETWDSNAAAHWQTCTVCGLETEHKEHGNYTNIKVVTPRTCTENASARATCGVCGATDLVLLGADLKAIGNPDYLASGHDFSGPLKYDIKTCTAEGQGNHAPTCVNCGLRDPEQTTAHTWTGLHTVSNGTCGDPNDPVIQEATCQCGATLHLEKTREHVPVADTSKDVQATCTESGKINGHRCTICGVFYDYEFVEALGHDFIKDDEQKADCETEGYIHYTCSRCKEEKTETIEKKSPNGQHKWIKKVGQAPTCLTDGTYDGEVCEICGATRELQGDYGKLEALGHLVQAETTSYGRVRNKVSLSGTPMDITSYFTIYSCKRCSERLGVEYWTVATAAASVIGGASYEIVSGKNAEITDIKNGIHIDGNMANDGGVHFNGTVLDALDKVTEQGKSKYQYKKIKANSFIIEFSDEFLAETADGTYPVEVINGSEYWPMLVTIKDHKLVALADMAIPAAPEITEAEMETELARQKADGAVIKELYVLLDPEKTARQLGDVDGNGKIESADARLALRRSVRLEDYPEGSVQFLACDVDFDNEITAGDARLILRASVGLEDAEKWKKA